MSKITTAHAALVVLLGTTLYPNADGWKRLPNPYKPEENGDPFLKKGWGLAFGAGINTNRQVGCNISIDRGFIVTLSMEYTELKDAAAEKAAVELALFEQQFRLINALEKDVNVEQSTMYARYVGDGGMEYVKGDTNRFLMIRTQMQLEYFEQLT